MRHAKTYLAIAAGILLLGALAVVLLHGPDRAAVEPAAGRKVTDLAGRSVVVPTEVRRLVAIGPGALRLVAYLGATGRIVGIEAMEKRMARDLHMRPYASALDDALFALPVVGPGGAGALPDPEQLLVRHPDLVIAVSLEPGQLDNIQAKTGLPVLSLSYGGLGVWREEASRSLSLLGEVLGKEQRAADINAYVKKLEHDLQRRTANLDAGRRPSAFFGGISFKGAQGLTSTEAGYPPGRMCSARNLADEVGKTGHFLVDKEQILVWNPDFIFVDIASRNLLDRDFQQNRDFYRLLAASKSDRVLTLLPYNYYNTNIELALINAYFVGKSLYPERFEDVSLRDKAVEIMETFLGIRSVPELPAYRPLRFPETGPAQWK